MHFLAIKAPGQTVVLLWLKKRGAQNKNIMTSLKQIKMFPVHQYYWFLGLRLWGRGSGQVGGATPFPQAVPLSGPPPSSPRGRPGRSHSCGGGGNHCTWEDTTGWKGVNSRASVATPNPTPLGCPLHSCGWVAVAGLDASSPLAWSKLPSDLPCTTQLLIKLGLYPFFQTQ